MVQVGLFGLMVCTIGVAALAFVPGFRTDRKGFGGRFLLFFWRYCLPAWAVMEVAVWTFTGRPYP
jgi:hypothetical protein